MIEKINLQTCWCQLEASEQAGSSETWYWNRFGRRAAAGWRFMRNFQLFFFFFDQDVSIIASTVSLLWSQCILSCEERKSSISGTGSRALHHHYSQRRAARWGPSAGGWLLLPTMIIWDKAELLLFSMTRCPDYSRLAHLGSSPWRGMRKEIFFFFFFWEGMQHLPKPGQHF